MTEINIISFDVPYPANYGGIIDVFYKIKYFHSIGIKVHLHCFDYGRGQQSELNKYCVSIDYYKRKTGISSQLSSIPYIVKSRTSSKLKVNLLKNSFPILFEGLHSCSLLNDDAFKNRIKIVRNHNIEHNYYNELSKIERNPLKKKYFKAEAKKLKKFEISLKKANLCLAVSSSDLDYFKRRYPKTNFILVPCFHGNKDVEIKLGKGDYVLYHGNLSVAENDYAAKFIIQRLFNNSDIPLKIAGLNPTTDLINIVAKCPSVEIISNPNDEEILQLINNAQINILYTKQATGLKLKLLNVLYNGRHCIVNSKMVAGTSLSEICMVEDDTIQLKKLIATAFKTEISDQEIDKRKNVLLKNYSNENNIQKILGNL